jgi:hypothetical protein
VLIPVTGAFLLAAGLRLLLGIAGFGFALVLYPDEPGLELGFMIGIGLLGVAALYRYRTSLHWAGRDAAERAPAGAGLEPWWRIALQVAFPSTIGLGVLLGISLALEPTLAAALAGFLVGLGFAAAALAVEQTLWERRTARVLYTDAGAGHQLWFRSRGLHRAGGPKRIAP